jgi:chromosome segregation ATPase
VSSSRLRARAALQISTSSRLTSSFQAGAIVRIKLINFMSYDQVEFRTGPHLNLILGPNGTGKSTVAAGIVIGTGFSPKVGAAGRGDIMAWRVENKRQERGD